MAGRTAAYALAGQRAKNGAFNTPMRSMSSRRGLFNGLRHGPSVLRQIHYDPLLPRLDDLGRSDTNGPP
jgi:hypothetical protein